MFFTREYFPIDLDIFKDSTSIILFFIFIGLFLLGIFIIKKQVALVKKGDFNIWDSLQCIIYGFIFSMAIMIVISIAFISAVDTPLFWEQKNWESKSTTPPKISSAWLVLPFLICLTYISIYPLVDFLFIALSKKADEGLTVFHKFIGNHIINRSQNKAISIISAIGLYILYIIPPFLLWAMGFPFIMIVVTWMLVYPLMIITYFGAKGYIVGLSNVYYHLPYLKRSIFLNFEDGKRSMREFALDPLPRIQIGLMLFIYIWAWISMIQTLLFYFTANIALNTYAYVGMVFVILLLGIIGYFRRFWGRKITHRGIDIFFTAYLIAAVGINVLVNFLIVNPKQLLKTFDYGVIGLHEIIPNFLLFAFAALIEEVGLIIFTTYYFLSKKNILTRNIKYSKITEYSRKLDPVPLFNFIKSDNEEIRRHAEENLLMMFEVIPSKANIDLNKFKFKSSLIDGICDYNNNSRRICYNILVQLERDVPNIVLPWIIEALQSPNYDKSIPFARSLLSSNIKLLEKIPISIIYSLIEDAEWHLKILGFKILSRLGEYNKEHVLDFFQNKRLVNKLIVASDNQVQAEILKLFALSELVLPIGLIIDKINHSSKEIRAAAIKNIKNIEAKSISAELIQIIISLMNDPAVEVRVSIFEVLTKIGRFSKFSVPISPFLDGLIDSNEMIRKMSILALEKYFKEIPESLDLDVVINKINPNNIEVMNSVLTLIGKLWVINPEKILTNLLILVKYYYDDQIKENISGILIEKYDSNPDLIVEKIIKVPDVSRFITKGIIAKTLFNLAQKDPENLVPKLIKYLESENDDVRLNAIVSLESLIDYNKNIIKMKPYLLFLQKNSEYQIKKEASKIISKIAKANPLFIKPVMSEILESIINQEPPIKIVLSKSLLEIANISPDLIPIDPIINFLLNEDYFIREIGAKILGFIGKKAPEEVSNALINIGLFETEKIVREAAVSSLLRIINSIENKETIIKRLVEFLDHGQNSVRRSSMNILSNIKELNASDIPFRELLKSLKSQDAKDREVSVGLLTLYSTQIELIFDKIIMLLEDESEDVRKKMVITMVIIIKKIGLKKILSTVLKHLSDASSIQIQRSIALILQQTVKDEDEEIKKRVISLLKRRCEMSQDRIICKALHKIQKGN